MLTIPGWPMRTCEGFSRREWLRVGGLAGMGLPGLSLPALWQNQAVAGPPKLRAKACIVLFMFGAPAHQDTWDLKPDAPSAVRGEFQPISTNVPGIQVSEHIPRLAQLADRYLQIRTVTHPDNTHTVAMHYMLSGVRHRRPATNPQNAADDFPCFGAVANHLLGRRDRLLPTSVSLNAPANQVSANNHIFPGFFAGFLGQEFDPLFVPQHANRPDFQPLPPIESSQRLSDRRHLLAQFDQQAEHLHQLASVRDFGGYHEQAFQLLTSSAVRSAFDVAQEPAALREKYGQTPFGQGCLLARRLVEAGVSLVTVNWERDDAYWDTHADNFNLHQRKLLPNMDQGFSTLLLDLEERGLLDVTLIVWLGEFGRTPTINKNAGRDHWAACNTVVLAGAGLRGGRVHGASDRQAAYPARDPVSPEDLAATIYHLLGINPHRLLRTPEGQPIPLSQGEPIQAIL
jgi:hypothetical protein